MSKDSDTPSVNDQINDIVSSMVKTESGTWDIPEDKLEGVSEAIVLAAKAEKRFRDTQGSYTKERQKNKELTTINSELTNHVISNATMHLSDEERAKLEDLKLNNPEEWREELNKHEQRAKELQQEAISEIAKKGKAASNEESRQLAYQEFTEATGIELSDQVIDAQLPASYRKDLESGAIDFEEFLTKAKNFLTPAIKGADDGEPSDKSLSDLPGGASPSETATHADINQSYADELY